MDYKCRINSLPLENETHHRERVTPMPEVKLTWHAVSSPGGMRSVTSPVRTGGMIPIGQSCGELLSCAQLKFPGHAVVVLSRWLYLAVAGSVVPRSERAGQICRAEGLLTLTRDLVFPLAGVKTRLLLCFIHNFSHQIVKTKRGGGR